MTAHHLVRAAFLARRAKAALIAGAFAGLAISTASAQYEVKEWANFETGKLPPNIISIGGQFDQRLSVVRTDSVKDQGPEFNNPEVGTHVLKLEARPNAADPTSYQLGIAVGDVLDRSKLGPNGRALFQADFFIGQDRLPSLAVLAMVPPTNVQNNAVSAIVKSFYRFGFTKNKQLYYSQFQPGDKNASVFEFDKDLLAQLPRPGWHRLALVCEGPEVVRCYVDGRETAFSPLRDQSMTQIMVGLLLADSDDSYVCYADNLSIQVSDDAPALPASPYDKGWNIAAGPSTKARTAGVNTALPTAKVTTALASEWLPPVQAWAKARADKTGMLLYFYAPGVARVEKMNEVLASNPAAKAYMARHACARVDVNQLEGGSIAKKYGIFKVPTFLVISPDAKQYKKVAPGPNDTWDQIAAQLAPL